MAVEGETREQVVRGALAWVRLTKSIHVEEVQTLRGLHTAFGGRSKRRVEECLHIVLTKSIEMGLVLLISVLRL